MSDDIKAIVAEALKEANVQTVEPVKEGNPGGMAILENIPKFNILGLSVGDAVKGAVAAGAGDALVKVVLARLPAPTVGQINTSAAIAKGLVAAGLQFKPVKGFLGANAANLGSLLLTIDAINEVVQIRQSVNNLVSKVTGTWATGSGLIWGKEKQAQQVQAQQVQAQQVQAQQVQAQQVQTQEVVRGLNSNDMAFLKQIGAA